MDLFTPVVPEDRFHKYFKTILAPLYVGHRNLLQRWAIGFVDRDGKFVQEFQISFNSAFWEIYLYAVFRDYGFAIDWTYASPDFDIERDGINLCVEAVTANAADNKPNEWDKSFSHEAVQKIDINALNREAMVRLLSAIHGKYKKYRDSYRRLPHVIRRPFVLAVAPFEQPFFNLQYDRPIKAVLFNYYVNEEEYRANPAAFPGGLRGKQLDFVQKDNGVELELGIFNDGRMREISAVIFSCTATWGKLSALEPETPPGRTVISSSWGTEPDGNPILRKGTPQEMGETLTDGLQIYHNPNALYPLPTELFRRHGVVQVYLDKAEDRWIHEEVNHSLQFRTVFRVAPADDLPQ